MTDDDTATLARTNNLLLTLVSEIRGLRSDLAGRKAAKNPRVLSSADTVLLADLLPKISAVIRGETFTVGSLREAAQARTRAANTLRAALADTALNALQIGRLLARAAKTEMPIEGLFAHRIGPTRQGATYCVSAESREHRLAASFATRMRETITP